MPFFILSLLVQVIIVIHIVKTGRSTTWIWLVVMLPVAGSIAYLVVEILPDFMNTRTGRGVARTVDSVINPNRDINAAARKFTVTDSVENTVRLADECMNKGLYSEAKSFYLKALQGRYFDDPTLLYGMARSQFMLNDFSGVRVTLEKLIALNPDYKNPEAHLLYARTLEKLNETEKAEHEYEVLYSYYVGPEAAFHYAKFLKSINKTSQANKVFGEILDKARVSGRHYGSLHKEIIKQVKAEMAG